MGNDEKLSYPMLMDVSADGSKAVICYRQLISRHLFDQKRAHLKSYHYLPDVRRLETREIISLNHMQSVSFLIRNAVFSPDGSKLLLSFRESDGKYHVAVQNIEGTQEKILFSHHQPIGVSGKYLGIGLNWAANGKIFIREGPVGSRG